MSSSRRENFTRNMVDIPRFKIFPNAEIGENRHFWLDAIDV